MVRSLNWLIFALITSVLFISPTKPLVDGDTGWHLMAGHYILEHGKIPTTNVFSFTSPDSAWFNMSWLADIIFALLNNLGGLFLIASVIIITNTLILSALCSFSQQRGAGIVATTLALILGLLAYLGLLLARPHIFTYVFFLAYLVTLYFYSKNPEQHRKKLFALPIIMLLWVNLHGGFIAGFTILGAYGVQFIIQNNWKEFKFLALITLLSAIAVFINPLGLGIIDAAMSTLDGEFKNYVDEWKPPTDLNYIVYFAVFSLVFFLSFKQHSVAERILCCIWLYLGCTSVRNMPVFALVSVPVLASGLQYIFAKNQKFLAKEADYQNDLGKPVVLKIARVLAIALPAALIVLKPTGFTPENGKNYAVDEVGYILATKPEAHVLNHYDYGGYMLYQSHGQLKTFIDGRADTAFSKQVIEDYISFHNADENWPEILDKYGIDVVLMPKELGVQLDHFNNDPSWIKAYEGDKAVVYMKE